MFKTADGDTLELAPWRMRRLMRIVAEMHRYPPGTPPQMLVNDLRQIIARARRVSTEPRLGTARIESAGACCRACLLARRQAGTMQLLGLSLAPRRGDHLAEARGWTLEFESAPRSTAGTLQLQWQYYPSLAVAAARTRHAGVYLLFRRSLHAGASEPLERVRKVPVYVGRSKDLPTRLREHRQAAARYQCGDLQVCVASMADADTFAVEHALVRVLGRTVANDRLQGRMTVGPGDVTINNLLPLGVVARGEGARKLTGNSLYLKRGDTLEIGWPS